MPRTTINLDPTVLRELRRRSERDGKTLGDVASELLARALDDVEADASPRPLRWEMKTLHARVDLEDRDAVQQILDRSES